MTRWQIIKVLLIVAYRVFVKRDYLGLLRDLLPKEDTPATAPMKHHPSAMGFVPELRKMVRGGGAHLLVVLVLAGVAMAAGQITVTGFPPTPVTLRGGVGVDIVGGEIRATGVAVPISIQPYSNISTAVRGNLAPFSLVNTFKTYTSVGRVTESQLAAELALKSPVFANYTTLARFGAGPTYNGLPIASGGVAGVQTFNARSGNVLPTSGDYSIGQIAGAATVATSGSYNDLSNKPTLSTVAATGSYTDLLNKPTLSTVAATGSYNDLLNKPATYTLPTATTTVLGGVKVDGTSVVIDGAGVISSTVSAGVASVDGSTGAVNLSGTYANKTTFQNYTSVDRLTVATFNNYSTAKGIKDAAQDASLTSHTSASSSAHPAFAITNTPSGSIAATDMQAALNELDGEKLKVYYVDTVAVGDGVTDDKAVLETFLKALPDGAHVEFNPDKTYYLSAPAVVWGPEKLKIHGNGTRIRAPKGFLTGFAYKSGLTGVNIPLSEGAVSFDVPIGLTVDVGDMLLCYADTVQYLSGYNAGVLAKVIKKSGQTVWLDAPVLMTFVGTKITSYANIDSFLVEDFDIDMTECPSDVNQFGAIGAYTTNSTVQNVNVSGNDYVGYGIGLSGNNNKITQSTVVDALNIQGCGPGCRVGYGFSVTGQNILVQLSTASNTKHAVVSAGRYWHSNNITYDTITAFNDPARYGQTIPSGPLAGQRYYLTPVDAHGNVLNWTLKNSYVKTEAPVVNVRNGRFTAENNIFDVVALPSSHMFEFSEAPLVSLRLTANEFQVPAPATLFNFNQDPAKLFFKSNSFTNISVNGITHKDDRWFSSSAPVSGTWERDAVVYKLDASAGDPVAWRCTSAGTPGTWEALYGTVQNDSVALTTHTTGDYVAGATANGGLAKTGTEAATLGLKSCGDGKLLKSTSGVWDCADDNSGAGTGSAITAGDSNVTVTDSGTGYIATIVDGVERARQTTEALDVGTGTMTTGSELVSNGTFNTDLSGNWNVTAGWSWESDGAGGGRARHTSGSSVSLGYTATVFTAGNWYLVSYDAGGDFNGGTATCANGRTATSAGTYTAVVYASSNSVFSCAVSSAFNGYVDNVSIKQLTGGSVYAGKAIGIGTAAPTKQIHIEAGAQAGLLLRGGNGYGSTQELQQSTIPTAAGVLTGGLFFGAQHTAGAFANSLEISGTSESAWSTGSAYPTAMVFKTTSATSRTERMRITGSGNVGIGTTSPGEKLEVAGNIKASTYIISGHEDQTASYTVSKDSSKITLASGTATVTLPAALPAGHVAVTVAVAGAAASGVSFAAGSGGSVSWGDAGTPTFINSKTADVVCHSQNAAATTTAAWRCVKGGDF